MAIPMLEKTASDEHMASLHVTEPIVNLIAVKSHECESGTDGSGYRQDPALEAVSTCRSLVRHERCHRSREMANKAECLLGEVSKRQKLLMGTAGEKGVSSWLTADPLTKCGTVLNKSDFRDAVCLRYDFPIDGLSTSCVCQAEMTVDHVFACPAGGYPSARHNEIRDLMANVMREVLPDVEIEPKFLPFQDEDLGGRTANRSCNARLDIRARGFWTRQQDAFFDIRVTHPKANLLSVSQVSNHLSSHEREKKCQYAERVNNID